MTAEHMRPEPFVPKLQSPSMGPPWPYPTIEERKPSPRVHEALAYCFIAGGVTSMIGGPVFLLWGQDEILILFCLAFLFYGLVGLLVGIAVLKALSQSKKAEQEVLRESIGYWGRVLSAVQCSKKMRVEFRKRWVHMRIRVELFAAASANSQTMPVGTQTDNSIAFEWFISEFQMSYVQPGGWCALLIHPRDASKVFLDGFATQDGQFVPKEHSP